MKNKIKKYFVVIVLVLTSFVFTNTVPVSNNPQNIRSYVFGPSPISEDGRSIFDSTVTDKNEVNIVHNSFWSNLRTKMDSIFVHILFLDYPDSGTSGRYQDNRADLIAFNQSQVEGLIKIQKNHNFKVILDLGLSLGADCRDLPAWQIAENAASGDMNMLRRFFYNSDGSERANKLKVDAINIDGPFLRLISGSQKAYSCNTAFKNGQLVITNKGYSQSKSVEIVGRYLSRLQRKINEAQGSNPKMNIVINLPNWNAGGYPGNFNLNLVPLMQEFARSNFYPPISEVGIDYPYSYLISNKSAFEKKVQALFQVQKLIRGNPKFSIIANQQTSLLAANTIAQNNPSERKNASNYRSGYDCMVSGRRQPLLLTYYNRCLSEELGSAQIVNKPNALALIGYGDRQYVKDTISYFRIINSDLPRGISVDTIYFESWYDFPNNSKEFGTKMVNLLSL